jgi:hypothetical protein
MVHFDFKICFFFIKIELPEGTSARNMRIVILDVTLFFIAAVKFGATVRSLRASCS